MSDTKKKIGGFIIGTAMVVAGIATGQYWLAVSGLGIARTSITYKGRREIDRSFTVDRVDTRAILPRVRGRFRIGAVRSEMRLRDTNDENLFVAAAWSVTGRRDAPAAGVRRVYFDGELAIDENGVIQRQFCRFLGGSSEGWIYPAAENELGVNAIVPFRWTHYDGSQTAVDPWLNTSFPTDWPATSVGARLAYSVFEFKYSESVWGSGRSSPRIEVEFDGPPVWDPRLGADSLANFVASDTPALQALDILLDPDFGLALEDEPERIDIDSFVDVANYQEEQVAHKDEDGLDEFDKRYRVNLAENTELDPRDRLEAIEASGRMRIVLTGGKYRCICRRPVAGFHPTPLTDAEIIGDWTIDDPGDESVRNEVVARFQNFETDYQVDEAVWPPYEDPNPYRTADGGRVLREVIDLPGTTQRWIAEQLAMTTLRESREQIVAQFTARIGALRYTVGDVVEMSARVPGWDVKPFWIADIALVIDPDMDAPVVQLRVVEYEPTVYSLDPNPVPPIYPDTNLMSEKFVPDPTNVTAISDETTTRELHDGTIAERIRLTFDLPTYGYYAEVRVRARRTHDVAGDPVADNWIPFAPVPAQRGGSYETFVEAGRKLETWEVEVEAVNAWGARSNPVTDSTVIGTKQAGPATPASLTIEQDGAWLRLAWPHVGDPDFREYEVRYGGTEFDDATPIPEGTGLHAPTFDVSPDVLADIGLRTITFRVAGKNLSGNYGGAVSETWNDPAPNPDASPFTVSHSGGTGSVTVSITDYLVISATRVRVHASTDPNFVASESTVVANDFVPALFVRFFNPAPAPMPWFTNFDLSIVDGGPVVPDGTTEITVRLEAWDDLTDVLDEPRGISDPIKITPGKTPSEATELPGDPGELDTLDVGFAGGRLKVRAQYVSWPEGGRLVLRVDPTDTDSAAWAALSTAQREAKWDNGTELDRTASGLWESPPDWISRRTYSVMAMTEGLDGTPGDILLHGYADDPIPDASAATITLRTDDRDVTVDVENLDAVNATAIYLHYSTTAGFTADETTRVESNIDTIAQIFSGIVRIALTGKRQFKFTVPDAVSFGTKVYFRLEARDDLTDVLADGPSYSGEFPAGGHTLAEGTRVRALSLQGGAPTNTPNPTGLALVQMGDGSWIYQPQWSAYSQGALKADGFFLYAERGFGASISGDEEPTMKAIDAIAHSYQGVDGSQYWTFGIAAFRRTLNGIERTAIMSPGSFPDWTSRIAGNGDYEQLIANENASTVKGGAERANTGLSVGGDLVGDLDGDTDVLGGGEIGVPTGSSIIIGTTGSPSNRSKVFRVPFSKFAAPESSQIGPGGSDLVYPYQMTVLSNPGYVAPNWSSTDSIQRHIFLLTGFTVAAGVTITGLRFYGYRGTTNEVCQVSLHRQSGGLAGIVKSISHSTTGWQTREDLTIDEPVTESKHYSIRGVLAIGANNSSLNARLAFVEVVYEQTTYEQTV